MEHGIYYINLVVGASVELGVKMERGDGGQKMNPSTDYDEQGRPTVKGAIKLLSIFSENMMNFVSFETSEQKPIIRPFLDEMKTDFGIIKDVLTNIKDLETKTSVVASCDNMITVVVPQESIVNTDPEIRNLFQEVQYQCIVVARMVSNENFEKYFDHQMERLERFDFQYDSDNFDMFVNSILQALKLCEETMFSTQKGPEGNNRDLVIEICENFVQKFDDRAKAMMTGTAREAMQGIYVLCTTILSKLGQKINNGNILVCRFCGKPKRVL